MQLPKPRAGTAEPEACVDPQTQQGPTLLGTDGKGTHTGSPLCASSELPAVAADARVEPARFVPTSQPGVRAASRSAYARIARPALGALLVATMAAPVTMAVTVLTLVQLLAYRRTSDVFFLQTRAGRYGKPFRIVKFRTMEQNADGALEPTRLGALLRKSHLDELPQLWNVVKGEMSLIGPRPETLDLEAWGEKEVPGFRSRLNMRPGITGLAQVIQDSTPPITELYREKLRLNQLYERQISLRMDTWILFRTAVRPVRPRAFRHSILKAG